MPLSDLPAQAPFASDSLRDGVHDDERVADVRARLNAAWTASARAPEKAQAKLDAQGKIWWLELNSNPVCPPTAYFAMFATLFGTPSQPPDAAYARNGRVFNSATAGQTPAANPKAEAARVPETTA